MILRLLALLKWLMHIPSRWKRSRNVSANAPHGPHKGAEQAVRCAAQPLHGTTTTDVSTASPYPATSSASEPGPAKSCSPWLPPELLSLILAELWEAPQTLEERRALLRSVVLVSRAWLGLMARTASRDVHIASKRNASTFIRLLFGRLEPESSRLAGRTPDGPFTRERAPFANEACRSITFYVDGRAPPGRPGAPPADLGATTAVPAGPSSPAADACGAISLVLQTASAPAADPRGRRYLPNLRHVSFRYTDVGYDDVFRHLEQKPFPRQVAHLAVYCAFTVTAPSGSVSLKNTLYEQWLRTRDEDRGFAPRPPHGGGGGVVQPGPALNVRHLALSGVPTAAAVAVLRVCPRLETLEISVPCVVCMGALAPLPAALRTLVLRPPGRAAQAQAKLRKEAGVEQVWHWVSCKGLEGGLFAAAGGRGAGLRTLIVHLPPVHNPELVAALRLGCERVPAEFVFYECDDSPGSPPVQ